MTDLSEVQGKLAIVQDKLHAPKSQNNDFGGFNYRSAEDIEAAVKPLLKEEGLLLTITDELVIVGERYYIKATSTVHLGDQSISVSSYREQQVLKGMVEAMITGSTSSYARKYSLGGLFLIDNEKDPDALPADKAADKAPADDPMDKAWYNDFDKHKEAMIAKIQAGITPDQIIKNLAEQFKVNKKVREQIKELAK